jgi:hypothetical protein
MRAETDFLGRKAKRFGGGIDTWIGPGRLGKPWR